MHTRLTIILGSLVGAFGVYGTQVAVRGSVAPSASGQAPTCCTAAIRSFVKLAEGDLNATTATPLSTEPIAVGNYTELVLYVSADVLVGNCFGSCCPTISAPQFRPDASTPFGSTGQAIGQFPYGGRVRVDGTDMMLSLPALDPTSCNHANYHYVVAGVQ
jgi:hypothetical protein